MRLLLSCPQCLREVKPPAFYSVVTSISESGRYEITCPRGHHTIILLQEQKFELLFEIGIYAICDGYNREAVSSFAVSLERFYEFGVRCLLLHNGVSEAALADTWKTIKKQSERQLGAFTALWVNTTLEVPPLLSSKNVNFRNEVIHQGRIPTREEAIAFGNDVLAAVRPCLTRLRMDYREAVGKVVAAHLRSLRDDSELVTTMHQPTLLSIAIADSQKSIEQHFEHVARWRDLERGTLAGVPPILEDGFDESPG